MPATNLSEKRLLWILLAAIFIALNLAAVNYFNGQRRKQKASLKAAQTQIAEGQVWIDKAAALPEKSRELPPIPQHTEQTAQVCLMDAISAAASNSGLTTEPNLTNPPRDTTVPAVTARVKFNGEFASLVKFLFELQGETSWRSIEKLDIKADNTQKADSGPPNIQGDMDVLQYYTEDAADGAPETPASEPASEPAPEAASEEASETTPEPKPESTPDSEKQPAEET